MLPLPFLELEYPTFGKDRSNKILTQPMFFHQAANDVQYVQISMRLSFILAS